MELQDVIYKKAYPRDHAFWSKDTIRITCMCMNTFGILPQHIRAECIKQMYLCSGVGGKLIIGCWHQKSLKTGFVEFYTQHPQLCGPCKEQDFDFDKGDFKSGSSNYTSHWFTEQELL